MDGALQLPHHGTQPQQVAVHVADDALHPHAEYLCGMISSSVLVGWKKFDDHSTRLDETNTLVLSDLPSDNFRESYIRKRLSSIAGVVVCDG